MRAFRKDFHAAGYITHVYTANAADFAIPQSRNRCYLVALRRNMRRLKLRPHIPDEAAAFAHITKVLKVARSAPMDLTEALLHDCDEIVVDMAEAESKKTGKTGITSGELDALKKAWKDIGEWLPEPGWHLCRTGDRESVWFNALCDRKKGCLQYHTAKCEKRIKAASATVEQAHGDAFHNPSAKNRCKLKDSQELHHSHHGITYTVHEFVLVGNWIA